MSRAQVAVREAVVADAPFLAELWQESCRRAERSEQVADLEVLIKSADESPQQRLVVVDLDGAPAGAVLLSLSTLNPMNPEQCVLVLAPTVAPAARRRGIGRTLLESAVAFGEEIGVSYVATAVDTASRDANRFMARLGLGPRATLRVAPLAVVQSKVAASAPGRAPAKRQLGQILAARRSMRRPDPAPPTT